MYQIQYYPMNNVTYPLEFFDCEQKARKFFELMKKQDGIDMKKFRVFHKPTPNMEITLPWSMPEFEKSGENHEN